MSRFVRLPVDAYSPLAFAGFSPQRGQFNLDDARAMMWMAQLAYESDAPQTVKAVAPEWDFDDIRILRARGRWVDTRALVGERADSTVVAFAGTDPAMANNLITNIRVRFSDHNTHEGFQNALNAIWPDIMARIEARRTGSERPILFTGHSLGGALAVLAADKLARADVMPAAIYTFGMPRVGNRDFAAIYNARLGERTFRLVHGGDIVACIPEWVVQPKKRLKREPFQHVGHLLKCPAGQKFARAAQLAPLDSNEPRFRAGLRENLVNRIGAMSAGTLFAPPGPGLFGSLYRVMPLSIRDHLPDRYRAALEP